MTGGIGRNGRHALLLTLPVLVGGLAAGPAGPAEAAGGAPTTQATTAVAQAPATYGFDIPAGPLPQSLAGFSAATGLQVLYTERTAHSAPALKGTMTADEALRRLLAGSGLDGAITASGTVTVSRVQAGGGALSLPALQVYGAKNATTLDDTTASVGIVTAEEIERRQIGGVRESFRTMANVMDSDWTDAGFVIRGVNSEGLTPGGAPLASLYVDGAQQTVQGARRGARGLWDVEQVEVYRGPQSTLTGRAALAGAVYIKTKDPTFENEAMVQGTVGTMDTVGGAFAFGGPVVDRQVAYRVAGEYETGRNDISYPSYQGYDRYDEFVEDEYYQLRGKLLLLPDDLPDSSALLTYSFAHDSPSSNDIAGPVLGFDYDDHRGDFNSPVFAEARTAETHNVALELGHDLTRRLKLTSLSTYSYTDLQRNSVNEGTAGETNITRGDMQQYVASQEIRGNYAAGAWKGVLGVYLAAEGDDSGYDRPANFGRNDVSRSESETFNAALFGEATYEFVSTWKLVAGGRVDHVDKTSENYFSRNGNVTVDQETSFDETVLLPKLGLIKELAPEHTLGFTIQRGFRNGGAAVQTSTGQSYTYDPEFAWNYELSYKGAFLDGRLRTGVNLFYMDWTDQQVEVRDDPTDFTSTRVTNAASSTSRGFEIEGRYLVAQGLDTFVSLGYVNTEFEDFSDASVGDLSGEPFPEAPEWSLAFGVFYEHESGFFAGADAKYLSEYLGRLDSQPHEYVDGYWVANMQVGFRFEPLTVTLFAENLFDNEYFVYNAKDAGGNDIAASLGAPQVIGLTASMKF